MSAGSFGRAGAAQGAPHIGMKPDSAHPITSRVHSPALARHSDAAAAVNPHKENS